MKIVDQMKRFIQLNEDAVDRALNRMAIDVERLSKERAPVLHGQLWASGHHLRKGRLNYVMIFDKEYARYQEFGGDGRRKIKNYTKAGTGAHYLRDSGNTISDKSIGYIKSEIQRIHI